MKDDLLLSLHLDGRLGEAERRALEARLRAEPELGRRFERMKALQELSARLPATEAHFTGEDLRARPPAPVVRRRWGIAAAAALLLALTHVAAFRLGRGGGEEVETAETPRANPLQQSEALLRRAAELGPGIPYEELRDELTDIRDGIHRASLPKRLTDLVRVEPAGERRHRAERMADALTQLDLLFDNFQDPGFLSVIAAGIAQGHLEHRALPRALPASANLYARTAVLPGGRIRLVLVSAGRGTPRVLQDEGTAEELERKYKGITFIRNK